MPHFAFGNVSAVAAAWIGLALLASLASVRIGLSVALVEILLGVLAGNLLHLHTTDWIDFLAGAGAVLLTFLAGAEIDPTSLRRFAAPSLAIGGAGFAAPLAAACAFPWVVLHSPRHAGPGAGHRRLATAVGGVSAVMGGAGPDPTGHAELHLN